MKENSGAGGAVKNTVRYGSMGAVGAGLGAAAAAGSGAGAAAVLATVASIGAIAKISQTSPLKKLLIAATYARENPELLNSIANSAQRQIVKSGLIVGHTPDGNLYLQERKKQ